jgi:predicted metal-dependent phosphotriesterase family hydrolase
MNENHAKLMPSPEWAAHIQDEVLPHAREHGVTEEQIAIMLTANPRRLLEPAR